MKYYVATRTDSNIYELTEFEDLGGAYNFYLQDVAHRMILKEVKPEVREKNV